MVNGSDQSVGQTHHPTANPEIVRVAKPERLKKQTEEKTERSLENP